MSVVDDFGRFSANLTLLRASCYPLKLDSVKEDSISKHLAECVDARLIVLYTVAGKAYLELQDFRQQVRAKDSKYPAPDTHLLSKCAADAKRPQTSVHLDGDGDVVVDGGVSPVVPNGDALVAVVIDQYHQLLPRCEKISVRNPKRVKRIKAADRLARDLCQQQGWEYEPEVFWNAYFAKCAEDPWLRGDVPNPKNARWKQNLDVLLAEDRFAGIMDRAISSMRESA
jgi:hypothetical protein